MPKTKISEYSSTANSNTDVASINVDEGCAPSGINNAIRAVMGHLKDFQQGTNGDTFNGPVNGTVGATTPATAAVTTLTTSSTVTHNGGTANGVAYLNGSKVLTTGSALTFDGSRLGINIASPTLSLEIGGNNANGYIHSDTGVLSIGSKNNYPVTFDVNNAEQMRLTSTGLGIGTSSPASKLQLQGASQAANTLTMLYSAIQAGSIGINSSGSMVFGLDGSTGTTTRLNLDSSGNLGLGVTPSAWGGNFRAVQIGRGTALWSGTATDATFLSQNAYYDGTNFRYLQTAYASYYSSQLGQHLWYTAPSGTAGNVISFTQAMTLDTSGNLLVGTTTSAGSKITVNNVGNGGVYVIQNSAGGYSFESNAIVLSGVYYHMQMLQSGTPVGSITSSGSTTQYNTSSDYRLKNITGALTGYKERLMSLQPKQGTWVSDNSEFRGFLAHEFANPYRASVVGDKDAVDTEGNPVMQGMQASSSEVMADLVAMVKELVTENASLKARLDAANL